MGVPHCPTPAAPKSPQSDGSSRARKPDAQAHRERQKRLATIERKIAKLDKDRKGVNDQLLTVTQAAEAQRLHRELTELSQQIESLEEEWLVLQEVE